MAGIFQVEPGSKKKVVANRAKKRIETPRGVQEEKHHMMINYKGNRLRGYLMVNYFVISRDPKILTCVLSKYHVGDHRAGALFKHLCTPQEFHIVKAPWVFLA